MPARIFVLVLALVFLANLHPGSAQAAGGLGPGDLSTQVQGIVDSALGAAQQPSNAASAAADDIVTQAVTLAQNAVAGASSTAAPSRHRAQTRSCRSRRRPRSRPRTALENARRRLGRALLPRGSTGTQRFLDRRLEAL